MGRNKIKIEKIENERIRQVYIIIHQLRLHFTKGNVELSRKPWNLLYYVKSRF